MFKSTNPISEIMASLWPIIAELKQLISSWRSVSGMNYYKTSKPTKMKMMNQRTLKSLLMMLPWSFSILLLKLIIYKLRIIDAIKSASKIILHLFIIRGGVISIKDSSVIMNNSVFENN